MITFSQLQVGYQRQAVAPEITLHLNTGSMTALTGANGSGKSTLLKTLAGLLPAVSGRWAIDSARAQIGWMPQRAELESHFPITVFELVAMGCWSRCGWFGGINRAHRKEIMACLEKVNMADFAQAQPGTLSGGQLQRVLFARLLMQQCRVWLLDEPFSGIDQNTTSLLLKILHQQHQQGGTLLVVLHDRAMVAHDFPQQLHLDVEKARFRPTLSVTASQSEVIAC